MANNSEKLLETKGTFQIIGKVFGVDKDDAYKDGVTKTGKPYRRYRFGVVYDEVDKISKRINNFEIFGMERDKVYFTKNEGDNKRSVVSHSWSQRNENFDNERLIGIQVGIEKAINKQTGKLANVKKNMTEYDICEYLYNNLKDGMSVFIKGSVSYSVYNDRHYTTFIPNQISLLSEDIDFNNHTVSASFKQPICFKGIEKNEDGEFVVSGYNISYNSVEPVEMYIKAEQKDLAKTIKNKVKPYSYITVWGKMVSEATTSKVEGDDIWGESSEMDRVSAPTLQKLIITGADPKTIDTSVYSEEKIDIALAKEKATEIANNDYGDNYSSEDSDFESIDLDDDDDAWG